jgi:ABC-type multidrug transport system ATPase subunit
VRNPDVLVLDEATAALDADAEAAVAAGLDAAMSGGDRAVLIIAHRLVTVRSADEIVVLRGGRVAERGTHAALVAAGGEYARLVAKQTGGETLDLSPHQQEAGAPASRGKRGGGGGGGGKPAERAAADAPEAPGGGGDLLPAGGAGGGVSTFDAGKAKR